MPRKVNKRKKLQAARLAAEKKAAKKGKRKSVGIIGHTSTGLTMAALLAHKLRTIISAQRGQQKGYEDE